MHVCSRIASSYCLVFSALLSARCFMMAAFTVSKRLCVNHRIVPEDHATLNFVGPYKLAGAEEEPDEQMPVTLVSFQANLTNYWLIASLGLPPKWFKSHCAEIPLVK